MLRRTLRPKKLADNSQILMKPQVKVRNAVEADLPSVVRLVNELENSSFEEAALRPIFLNNLKDPHTFYLLAYLPENQQVVGFISLYVQDLLHHAGRTGQVQEMIVTEGFQEYGIGKILLEQVEQIALNLDLLELEVSSNRMRTRAHGFYQRNAYEFSHFKFVKKMTLL